MNDRNRRLIVRVDGNVETGEPQSKPPFTRPVNESNILRSGDPTRRCRAITPFEKMGAAGFRSLTE
jgi:hypothetical protein